MTPHAILSRTVDIGHLPPEAVEIVANGDDRRQLAAAYDLVAVDDLSASAVLTPGARGSVDVDGRVVADIVQTCVVSLVPVSQHIDERFSLRFVRAADVPPSPKGGGEVVIDPDAPDPPEIIEGSAIDVGALVEETFVLAIDPYPRAPGAALPVDATDGTDNATDSPFAALARLASRPPENGR